MSVEATSLQGVVKSYDPISGDGTVLTGHHRSDRQLDRVLPEAVQARGRRVADRLLGDGLDDERLGVTRLRDLSLAPWRDE